MTMNSLADLLALYQFPSGRRLRVFRRTRTIAQSLGVKAILALCDAGLGHEEATLKAEQDWELEKNKPNDRAAKTEALDRQIDAKWRGLFKLLNGIIDAAGPVDDATTTAARKILHEIFPAGLRPVILIEYPQQAASNDALRERLEGPLRAELDAVHGRFFTDPIKPLNAEFRVLVDHPEVAKIAFADVERLDSLGQENLCELAAACASAFLNLPREERRVKQALLLVPLREENEALGEYIRNRRRVRDIDPNTGAEKSEPLRGALTPG